MNSAAEALDISAAAHEILEGQMGFAEVQALEAQVKLVAVVLGVQSIAGVSLSVDRTSETIVRETEIVPNMSAESLEHSELGDARGFTSS